LRLDRGGLQLGRGKRQDLVPKLFDALRELMTPPDPPKRPIGFVTPEDKASKKASGQAKGKT
jgi:hypothetical protein